MKLSDWADKQGIHYNTAYRWFRTGTLPVKSYQTKTGTIIVEENEPDDGNHKVAIYCRVSSHNKKNDLEAQVKRCESYCVAKGYSIDKTYKEIASGMNDDRRQLWKALDGDYNIIVVENKDRLTRFGFNYIARLASKLGVSIEVINKDHMDESDLIKDMISIVTSFCCRLYGARRGQNKSNRIKEVINDKVN
jgi:predicted site-specific integrase-resolvase